MNKKYYLITVYGDVEPVLSEPCDTSGEALALAQEHRVEDDEQEDGLFILSIDADGTPHIGAFSGGDLEGEDNE